MVQEKAVAPGVFSIDYLLRISELQIAGTGVRHFEAISVRGRCESV
jgi:hypothetical protein